MIGKLHLDGTLTDLANREFLTYGDGSIDVGISAPPVGVTRPWGYDPATQSAIPYVPPFNLLTYQQAKCAAIQARTQQLLALGFTWNGQQFPISDQIIARWEGLLLKAQGGRVTYPYQVPTIQLKKVQLKNQNDLNGLYQAAEARYEALISTNDGSGGEGDLMCQVMAAQNQTAVDAVTDARS